MKPTQLAAGALVLAELTKSAGILENTIEKTPKVTDFLPEAKSNDYESLLSGLRAGSTVLPSTSLGARRLLDYAVDFKKSPIYSSPPIPLKQTFGNMHPLQLMAFVQGLHQRFPASKGGNGGIGAIALSRQ